MYALSLRQPWATLLVHGVKQIETRSWKVGQAHLGCRLAIHAARAFPPALVDLCAHEPLKSALRRCGIPHWTALPRGAVVGSVLLVECTQTELLAPTLDELEQALGNFTPGRWGWVCREPTPLVVPHPMAGNLGMFNLPDNLNLPL